MDIYNAVIQNPERVKDDSYYRSRKGVLMQELKQRFGNLINVCQGPHGEERFETDDNPSRFVELVRECLSFFTPWNTYGCQKLDLATMGQRWRSRRASRLMRRQELRFDRIGLIGR